MCAISCIRGCRDASSSSDSRGGSQTFFARSRSADWKLTMNPAFSRVIILCVAAGEKRCDFICESGAANKAQGGDREVRAREHRKKRRGERDEGGIYGKS